MEAQTTIPLLLSVPLINALLGTSNATGYRIAKQLPKANIPGRWRITTADFEKLIGRKLTVADYQHALAKSRGESLQPNDAPGMDKASEIESLSDGSRQI